MSIPIRSNLFTCIIIGGLLLASLSLAVAQVTPSRADNQPTALSDTPLMFIENVGQFPDDVRFQVLGGTNTMWLTQDALWMTVLEPAHEDSPPLIPPNSRGEMDGNSPLPLGEGLGEGLGVRDRRGVNLKLSFVGANPHPEIEPFLRQKTYFNYLRDDNPNNWRTQVPIWGGVRYKELYPGIDLLLSGQDGTFAPRLVAHEGADLSVVRWQVEGATVKTLPSPTVGRGAGGEGGEGAVKILPSPTVGRGAGGEGDVLRLLTDVGEVSFPLLSVVTPDGTPVDLSAYPVLVEGNQVRQPFEHQSATERAFEPHLPAPNAAQTLVYSTFIGGSAADVGRALALAPNGDVVVTGRTQSSEFPTTVGAFETTHAGENDLLVAKLASDGSTLRYATFIGGGGNDEAVEVALDNNDDVVLTGYTFSTDFPTTAGAYQPTHSGKSADLFVLKLAADGGSLRYSTFVGGNSTDAATDLALDGSGNVFVAGSTDSTDFPTTNGAYDTTHNGFTDAFAFKLAADGSELLYSTLLGGSNSEEATALALTTAGEAVVTGRTESADFPTSEGVFDGTHNEEHDLFVLKLAADGTSLLYSTFVGGTSSDWSYGLALSANEEAVITGYTFSSDFPTTAGAYDSSLNGQSDIVLFALSNDGTSLRYSTFIGGSSFDYAYDVTLSSKNEPIVVGWTESTDFPTTNDAYDGTHNGGGTYNLDGYWLRLAADGTTLRYSSFIGGADDEYNQAVQLSNEGDALMTGYTASSDFPTSAGTYDTAHNGSNDLFVMRFAESNSQSTPTSTPTASHTPSPSATFTPSATPTSNLSPTASPASTPTSSVSPIASHTPSPSLTPTSSVLPTASHTPSPSASPTSRASPTASSTPTTTVTVTHTPTSTMLDEYEPDDNCKDALPIPVDGTIQTHTLHEASDEDWVSFPVQQGETYMIEGRVPPESAVDLTLEVYDGCNGGPEEQEPPFSVTIRYYLLAPTDGTYYLRLQNQASSDKSTNNEYHLSVRELNEVSYGALIVVAGKFQYNDSLQENINHVTKRVYRTFREQGHPDEQIYYLAHDQEIDVDEDGSPDVDNLPSSDNLQTAITQWAAQYVNANQALTLFMVDHGRRNRFYLDGTRDDWVTPTELHEWLNDLEAQKGVKVNVIIDASRSGSFIEGEESISKEGRVIITSTDSSHASHASRGGLHFSDALLSALAQGMSVKAAFDEATWSVRRLPRRVRTYPQLDSDGNRIANEPSDAPEAERRGFHSPGSFPTQQWSPYIKDAQLSLKGTQATLSVDVLDHEREAGIQEVSAVIYAPSYQPSANEDEITIEPARLPLTKTATIEYGARYQLTADAFNEEGTYEIMIYAEDKEEVSAQPVVLELQVGDYGLYLPLLVR